MTAKESRRGKVYGGRASVSCGQCRGVQITFPALTFLPQDDDGRPISPGTVPWAVSCPRHCGYTIRFVAVSTPRLPSGRGWLVLEEVFGP